MSAPNVLVYVHGTNGSGKSTLARALLAASGGVRAVNTGYGGHDKAYSTLTNDGVVFVGKYGAACGGVDGVSPYAAIHDICLRHAIFPEAQVFAEGLITPGVDTCKKLAGYFDEHLFIFLDTPVEQCIANVLRRRARKGTAGVYSPENLHKKRKSALSWATRLEKEGLNVVKTTWIEAYLLCLHTLGVQAPTVDQLLGTTP